MPFVCRPFHLKQFIGMSDYIMNIVFDLGGVVLAWNPDHIINQTFTDPKTCDLIRLKVFQHKDWLDLDKGTLEPSDAINRFVFRTGLNIDDIKRLMAFVPHSLTLINGTLDLIHRLKHQGHRLFCLSNMHRDSYTFIQKKYSFWDVFEGIVISSHIKSIKPESAIYQYLLEKYSLKPRDTVFIDDMPINLEAAACHDINTIQFINAEDCEEKLIAMISSKTR